MFEQMIALVLARVLLSVSANAVQKRLVLNRAQVSATWLVTYGLMLAPAFVLALSRPSQPESSFWWNILLGGVLDAIGNLAMVAALRATDLSVFGPLNAFRPILALLFGWFFLGESPTALGGLGVGITVGGAVLLLGKTEPDLPKLSREQLTRILGLRVIGLSLSTFGAVFLKRAALASSAEWALGGWILCGFVCLAGTMFLRRNAGFTQLRLGFREHRAWLLLHAALFFVMQWLTIRIFQETLLAYSFVFFQLGMIAQVIAGRVLFREPAFRQRLAGCLVMSVGSALILWRG